MLVFARQKNKAFSQDLSSLLLTALQVKYNFKTGDKVYIICHFCDGKGHFLKKRDRHYMP